MADNLFSEDWAVVACIDPDAYAIGTVASDVINMADVEQLAVVTALGTVGSSATVVTTVKDSSASPLATITGKTTTLNASDTQSVIHVRSGEVNSNAQYVTVEMEVTTAASDCGVTVFAKKRHRPASDGDLASVVSIVN